MQWFKQIQLFQLPKTLNYSPETLLNQLSALTFKPCLPSMAYSVGWVNVIDDEEAPLIQALNRYTMLCLQIEEKILPPAVIRQELKELTKRREMQENRKMRKKEKQTLADEIVITLLPRAFSKLTRLYAYIDPHHHWLVLGTTQAKKTEQFISLLKKSIGEEIYPVDVKKVAPILTDWLTKQNQPAALNIEKACLLQDPEQQHRLVRCQQQDLFAASIQALLKDGCAVKQLALSWHDRINFVLAEDYSLRSIQYQDKILEAVKDLGAETVLQKFNADFFIMTETLTHLLGELHDIFQVAAPLAAVSGL